MRHVTASISAALVLWALSVVAAAGIWGDDTTPAVPVCEWMGVNIQFTGAPKQDLDLIRQAGFGWVRRDFTRESVEREKGAYRFDEYDELLAGLEQRGIKALFVLDSSHKLHEEARSVRTLAGRDALVRFAVAAATRYRGRGVWWEIRNEPIVAPFGPSEPNVEDYAALFEAVSRAILSADPDTRVLGPASSGLPWPFLAALLKRGAVGSYLSVHPYRSTRPETVGADYERLMELMRAHRIRTEFGWHRDRVVPLVSSEWGYSTLHHGGLRIGEDLQAAYFVRMMLTNRAKKISLSIWYDWANDGSDPGKTEHNFGLVTRDRQPKPAYLAAKTLARLSGQAVPIWVEGEPRFAGVRVASNRAKIRVTSLTGESKDFDIANGVLPLLVSQYPQYYAVVESHGVDNKPAEFHVEVEPHADRIVVQVRKDGAYQYEIGALAVVIGAGDTRIQIGQRVSLERRDHLQVPVTWLIDRPIRMEVALHDDDQKVLWARTQPCGYAALKAFSLDWPRPEAEPRHLTASLDGDAKVAGEVLLVAATTKELGGKAENALRLEYRFGKGHKLAVVKPSSGFETIAGQPRSLSLWVKGDGLGNTLRVRFRDARGETFEPNASAIEWTDWQRLTLPLDGTLARSWGGGEDGKVDYPIVWESLLVVDSRGEECLGSIEVASPLLVYNME